MNTLPIPDSTSPIACRKSARFRPISHTADGGGFFDDDESNGFKGIYLSRRLVLDTGLTPAEKFLLGYFCSFGKNKQTGRQNRCTASDRWIAKQLGLTHQTVRNLMLRLRRKGFITGTGNSRRFPCTMAEVYANVPNGVHVPNQVHLCTQPGTKDTIDTTNPKKNQTALTENHQTQTGCTAQPIHQSAKPGLLVLEGSGDWIGSGGAAPISERDFSALCRNPRLSRFGPQLVRRHAETLAYEVAHGMAKMPGHVPAYLEQCILQELAKEKAKPAPAVQSSNGWSKPHNQGVIEPCAVVVDTSKLPF